jgi:hypothetical protein
MRQPELWHRVTDVLAQPAPASTGFIHGRATDPWWNVLELARYGNDDGQRFTPIQVAGRTAVNTHGMTERGEHQLRGVIS